MFIKIKHSLFIKTSLIFISLLSITPGFSQEILKESSNDFNKDNWRVLFQVNGPNNWNAAINFTKPIDDNWVLRFGISPEISFSRSIGDNPDPTEFVSYASKSSVKRFGANVSLGAEYHFSTQGKLDPYLIMGTGIGGFTEIVNTSNAYVYVDAQNSGLIERDSEEKSKSAPQLSIDPFVGFGVNYFFHERMAFGIEYSLSPNMNLIQGSTNSTKEEKEVFEDGTVIETTVKSSTNRNAFFVNVTQQIGFHFLYVLHKKE